MIHQQGEELATMVKKNVDRIESELNESQASRIKLVSQDDKDFLIIL